MLGPESGIRRGTILVCWKDCGYLRVDEVTAEGVVCKSAFGPHLYTWSDLEYFEAAIDSSLEGETRSQPPKLVARGGTIDLSKSAPSLDKSGPDHDVRAADLAIIRALLVNAQSDWKEISVRVDDLEFRIERVDSFTARYEAKLIPA